MEPQNLEQFECIVGRLIDRGDFEPVGDRETMHQALQEVAYKIRAARYVDPSITACERLLGALFVRSVEHTVAITPSNFVTLQEICKDDSVV